MCNIMAGGDIGMIFVKYVNFYSGSNGYKRHNVSLFSRAITAGSTILRTFF